MVSSLHEYFQFSIYYFQPPTNLLNALNQPQKSFISNMRDFQVGVTQGAISRAYCFLSHSTAVPSKCQ